MRALPAPSTIHARTHALTRVAALALFALAPCLATGCVLSPLNLEGRPCPCADGWRCDVALDVCVRATGPTCATRSDCSAGDLCIDGRCVRPDAGPPCVAETESCNGDDDDCDGATDEGAGICTLPRAASACTRGACAVTSCQAGFDDCNRRADDGCETSLGTTADCGACGDACSMAAPFCAPGAGGTRACAASCPAGLDECSGACVDLDTDLHHCGACDDPCAPTHGVGRCSAGACSVASCDAPWSDCDDDVSTGCEVSLDSDTSCGSCTRDCTSTTAGTCTVGRCVSGGCAMTPGGPGTTCRPAVSLCDVPETCSGDGTCPADRFGVAGVVCRASECGGLDPRELCTGTSAACPPPCGCAGQPCCSGTTPCSFGHECAMGMCAPCGPTDLSLSGGFPMPAGAGGIVRNAFATAASISLTDSMASGAIALPAGVTATGTFTSPCATSCDWLTGVSASGTSITFTSGGAAGATPTMATITLSGALASGSVSATPVSPTMPGSFTRVTTSGGTITFTDQAMVSGTITLTRLVACTP